MNSAEGHTDMTLCRFPDSEIDGSTPVYGSPSLIAVLPRPSSPLGAKASTECSYYLDHRNCWISFEVLRHMAKSSLSIVRPKTLVASSPFFHLRARRVSALKYDVARS